MGMKLYFCLFCTFKIMCVMKTAQPWNLTKVCLNMKILLYELVSLRL